MFGIGLNLNTYIENTIAVAFKMTTQLNRLCVFFEFFAILQAVGSYRNIPEGLIVPIGKGFLFWSNLNIAIFFLIYHGTKQVIQ